MKDMNPGSVSSYPSNLVNVNGTLFFSANDGIDGTELWKSDGTSAGTLQVSDINAGHSGSYPIYLTNVNGVVLFRATDGVSGYQLWKSDGTAAGTVMIDITGANNSAPGPVVAINGWLAVAATSPTSGRELWIENSNAIAPQLDPFATPTMVAENSLWLAERSACRYLVRAGGSNTACDYGIVQQSFARSESHHY